MTHAHEMPTLTQPAALASQLRVSVLRLTRRLRAERSGHTLTLTQTSTLFTLARHGPLTPGELAGHEQVQPPSMSRVLAVLAERGLVERTPHPTDGRQHVVSLTGAARRLLREDRRRREAWLSRRLAALTPVERDILRQAAPVLDRITRR
jgi:DNA-binding MarR family transcriptional regulator